MAPFRWPSIQHDIALAKEVAANAPDNPREWDLLADTLSKAFTTDEKIVEVKGRGCRDRMERLLEKYKKEDAKALKRSGSEEEFTELNQLCEDILTYRRDMNELRIQEKEAKKRLAEENRSKGEEMRRAALEGLSRRRHSSDPDPLCCSSGEDNSDSIDDDESMPSAAGHAARADSRKKSRKRASKLSAIDMLASKYKRKAELQDRELEFRKQELQFQREKFEAEAEERKVRLELELEERKVMLTLLKDKLAK